MRYISTSDLVIGDTVAREVKDRRGRLLLSAGSDIHSRQIIKRLLHNNVAGVYVNDNWSSDIFIEQVIDEETINKTMDALESFNIDRIKQCADEIVDKIVNSDKYMNDVACIRKYDENTALHSINVAIASVTLGIGIGLSYERLKNLSVGALLHDIGKTRVPINILNKKGKLNENEREIMKKHPRYGYDIIRKDANTTSPVRVIAYQHHENWDGTGYPKQLKGEQLYILASIVHICDVYDALISKRTYKKPFSISKTIEILSNGCNKQFDPELLAGFFRYIPIYNKGTIVKLSNNEQALVYENNRGDMLSPTVKLKDGKIIDLRLSSLSIID